MIVALVVSFRMITLIAMVEATSLRNQPHAVVSLVRSQDNTTFEIVLEYRDCPRQYFVHKPHPGEFFYEDGREMKDKFCRKCGRCDDGVQIIKQCKPHSDVGCGRKCTAPGYRFDEGTQSCQHGKVLDEGFTHDELRAWLGKQKQADVENLESGVGSSRAVKSTDMVPEFESQTVTAIDLVATKPIRTSAHTPSFATVTVEKRTKTATTQDERFSRGLHRSTIADRLEDGDSLKEGLMTEEHGVLYAEPQQSEETDVSATITYLLLIASACILVPTLICYACIAFQPLHRRCFFRTRSERTTGLVILTMASGDLPRDTSGDTSHDVIMITAPPKLPVFVTSVLVPCPIEGNDLNSADADECDIYLDRSDGGELDDGEDGSWTEEESYGVVEFHSEQDIVEDDDCDAENDDSGGSDDEEHDRADGDHDHYHSDRDQDSDDDNHDHYHEDQDHSDRDQDSDDDNHDNHDHYHEDQDHSDRDQDSDGDNHDDHDHYHEDQDQSDHDQDSDGDNHDDHDHYHEDQDHSDRDQDSDDNNHDNHDHYHEDQDQSDHDQDNDDDHHDNNDDDRDHHDNDDDDLRDHDAHNVNDYEDDYDHDHREKEKNTDGAILYTTRDRDYKNDEQQSPELSN